MNRAVPICLLLLAAIGAWAGYGLGKPKPTPAAEAPTAPPLPEPRSAVELISLLNKGTTQAGYYALRRELGALPFAEVQSYFEKTAIEDASNPRLDNDALDTAISVMLERDPEATIALVRKHFKGMKRSHAWYSIIEQWGYADPHATLAFVAGLDKSEDHSCNVLNSTTGFLMSWAKRDPEEALAAWLALPEPKFADAGNIPYSAEVLAMGLAEDPAMRQNALEMLLDQPASEGRGSAIAGALATWVHNGDFDEATTWLTAQDLTPAESGKAAIEAAGAAVRRGNRAAADWLVEHVFAIEDSSTDRANLLDSFAEDWTREAPNACAEWLATLPPGNETDWAVRGFLRQVEYQDPESGFHWTRQISNAHLRMRQAQEFWNHWRRVAPVAAQDFIPQLTAKEREWLKIGA